MWVPHLAQVKSTSYICRSVPYAIVCALPQEFARRIIGVCYVPKMMFEKFLIKLLDRLQRYIGDVLGTIRSPIYNEKSIP